MSGQYISENLGNVGFGALFGKPNGVFYGFGSFGLDLLDLAFDTAAAERDESEPRVSSTVLAADVIREQSGGQVMDRLELRRAEITGNQELPKVLYIVPWKKSDPGDLMGRPVNTLLDEILAPLDREEFIRRVGYYGDLYGEKDE